MGDNIKTGYMVQDGPPTDILQSSGKDKPSESTSGMFTTATTRPAVIASQREGWIGFFLSLFRQRAPENIVIDGIESEQERCDTPTFLRKNDRECVAGRGDEQTFDESKPLGSGARGTVWATGPASAVKVQSVSSHSFADKIDELLIALTMMVADFLKSLRIILGHGFIPRDIYKENIGVDCLDFPTKLLAIDYGEWKIKTGTPAEAGHKKVSKRFLSDSTYGRQIERSYLKNNSAELKNKKAPVAHAMQSEDWSRLLDMLAKFSSTPPIPKPNFSKYYNGQDIKNELSEIIQAIEGILVENTGITSGPLGLSALPPRNS